MIRLLGSRVVPTTVVVALVGVLLAGVSGVSAHAAQDPNKDYPRFPKRCLGPNEIIPHTPQKCRLVTYRKGRPTVVIWGDSHAWQHIPALRDAARQRNTNLVAFVFGSCAPFKMAMRDSGEYKTLCELNNALALDYVTRRERAGAEIRVVLGGHWWANKHVHAHLDEWTSLCSSIRQRKCYQAYLASLFNRKSSPLFRALGRRGIDTDVIGQAAVVPTNPPECADRNPYTCALPRARALPWEARVRTWLRARMADLPGRPRLITVTSRFCGPKWCRGYKDGIFTFYDDNHLSATRTRTLKPEFLPSFGNFR